MTYDWTELDDVLTWEAQVRNRRPIKRWWVVRDNYWRGLFYSCRICNQQIEDTGNVHRNAKKMGLKAARAIKKHAQDHADRAREEIKNA